MTDKLDMAAVDAQVGTLIDWVIATSQTNGEVCAILGHALQVMLDAIPIEDRSERMLVLARALDAAMEELESIMNGEDEVWPAPPVQH